MTDPDLLNFVIEGTVGESEPLRQWTVEAFRRPRDAPAVIRVVLQDIDLLAFVDEPDAVRERIDEAYQRWCDDLRLPSEEASPPFERLVIVRSLWIDPEIAESVSEAVLLRRGMDALGLGADKAGMERVGVATMLGTLSTTTLSRFGFIWAYGIWVARLDSPTFWLAAGAAAHREGT